MYLRSKSTHWQNLKTIAGPPAEISIIDKTKESVTVSIATTSGRRNFASIFSMLQCLFPENFVKILILVLELKMKICQISVPYETLHVVKGNFLMQG